MGMRHSRQGDFEYLEAWPAGEGEKARLPFRGCPLDYFTSGPSRVGPSNPVGPINMFTFSLIEQVETDVRTSSEVR